ncbi:M1 family aminopeptidase [uncultured Aquimarina sp.]|uniref:ABC transporter permease/M1 family aminopeptidase n=1 Tax=uncultured Aquimarina sp. TaxID=575652 RepID=UPI002617159C|nr:M1 family aminopeptidase [uncultured Aquimarina sp.]
MFKHIFLYELKYWIKKPVLYVYLVVFSGLAFIAIAGTGGLFDPPLATKAARLINSPFEINYLLQYFNKLLLFLLPAIIGATVYKDFRDNTHSVLYSFPIKKKEYILGKFINSFTLVFGIAITITVVMILTEHLPGLDDNKMGDFRLVGYLQAFLLYTVPNLLFYGAIVFAVVAYFRNIYAGFVIILILFLLQNITQNLFQGVSIALLDPFGQNAVIYETQYWTLEDKNFKLIPVLGVALYNRLVWFAITVITVGYVYRKFALTEHPSTTLFKKKTEKRQAKKSIGGSINIRLPKVSYQFSNQQQLKNSWLLSAVNFQSIVKSWMFYIIIAFGILAVLFSIAKVTNNSEMTILPVTNVVLTIPAFFFTTIIMLLTFIYSGMLVHKDQVSNMNQLVDATPIPNFTLLLSKIIAIIKMQALLLFIMMLSGIIIQVYNSYYNLEIGLYVFDLFIVKFSGLIIWALASVFIHTLVRNTYLGIFILLIGWFGISGLKQIGMDSFLILFNFSEPMPYSDMNAYGDQLAPYFLVKGYWTLFGILLVTASYLLWIRGMHQSIKERLSFIKTRFNRRIQIIGGLLLIGFVVLGFTIHREENKQVALSSQEQDKAFDQFEKSFSKYANIINQPKVTDISLNIAIFPKTNDLEVQGSYTLINTSQQVIDTILVKTGFNETTSFTLDKASEIVDQDPYVKFSVLKLAKGLHPNDSIQLNFTLKSKPTTLFKNNANVLNNGTLFKNNIFPRLGYFLHGNEKHPSDATSKQKHYYSQDSDFISLKTVISTSQDQTAISPGYLKRAWKEDKRNYFEYQTDAKIKNSLSFSSGVFEIEKESYKNVDLEIYYHKDHTYNLSKMKEGLKAALDYNAKHFGAYQFTEARIVEFPITEGTYASVMANSIPTSEMRFIANSSDETIDISFYTIAHELTHQWWANQLVPADALGAIMLSESITEYISLNIFEEHYGAEKKLDFLKMQHGRYIKGRTSEIATEPPLYLVTAGQQYLAYGKGTVVFNTLSHYLGKEKTHTILKDFFDLYKNKEAPYPTSIELVESIRKATPDSLKYMVKDLFETVTFYDTKIENVKVTSDEKGTYAAEVDFSVSKHRNRAEEASLNLKDYIEIGFYNEDDELISLEVLKISQNSNQIIFRLKEKPYKVVIDPNYLLIEKDIDDNVFRL